MANKIYPKIKTALMKAQADMTALTWKAVLVDLADYTQSDAHEFLSDVPAAARVAEIGLASVTIGVVGEGVFDADDVVFTTVSGDESEALIIYADSGVEGTSRLAAFIDTATGLPISPNGGNIPVNWNASGIFAL